MDPVRILVVDDDPDVILSTAKLLAGVGYLVDCASTGYEAWTKLQQAHPDILLLDNALPEVSGLDVCRRLKRDARLRNTFVVMVSAHPITAEDQYKGLQAGADDYIIKPITDREMIAHVQSMINIRRREVALLEKDRELEDARRVALSMMQDADVQRQKAEDAWQKLEESFQSLRMLERAIENSPNSVIITDRQGHIQYVNPRATEVTGYSVAELMGQNPRVFKSGFHSSEFYEEMWTTILAGIQWRGELLNKKKNGEVYWESTSITPVKGPTGEIINLVAVKEDVTERQHIMEALEAAKLAAESSNRAKSTFLATMSHEIRTPLNAILGFAQLLLRDPSLSTTQLQRINTINRSGEHLLALINDILEMSKIEAGRATLNVTSFDLHALIHDLEAMIRVRTDARQLQFSVTIAPDLPRNILSDENKLRQIFINLLGNAAKFTELGSIDWNIRIARQATGESRLIADVIDTGPGITSEDLPRIFDTFEQAFAGRRMGEGTGLGLSISQKFAQILSGEITVSSEVGKGSIFSLNIAVQVAPDGAAAAIGNRRRVIELQPGQTVYRVLIADDNAESRLLISDMLEAAGFETRQVANGEEAVTCYQSWNPQIVLMDMFMPILNGYQATRRIRELNTEIHVCIIAVTANAFEDERLKILETGVNGYIRKPFTADELFEAIRTCTDVQYIYEQDQPGIPSGLPTSDISGEEALKELPLELVIQMEQETISANFERLMRLIDQVSLTSPAIAHSLRELAVGYRYERLLEIFRQRVQMP
jgi:PAS domain S-box-containing protein